jgi:hypothetical protein
MRHRVGQRITQALGRANRIDTADHCIWGWIPPLRKSSPTLPSVRRFPRASAQPSALHWSCTTRAGPPRSTHAAPSGIRPSQRPRPTPRARQHLAEGRAPAAARAAAVTSQAPMRKCRRRLTCGSATCLAPHARPAKPPNCSPPPESKNTQPSGATFKPTPCSIEAVARTSPPPLQHWKTQLTTVHHGVVPPSEPHRRGPPGSRA